MQHSNNQTHSNTKQIHISISPISSPIQYQSSVYFHNKQVNSIYISLYSLSLHIDLLCVEVANLALPQRIYVKQRKNEPHLAFGQGGEVRPFDAPQSDVLFRILLFSLVELHSHALRIVHGRGQESAKRSARHRIAVLCQNHHPSIPSSESKRHSQHFHQSDSPTIDRNAQFIATLRPDLTELCRAQSHHFVWIDVERNAFSRLNERISNEKNRPPSEFA